jgi:hypothetical protein
LLERFVHMELSTVISGDGADGMRLVAEDVGGAPQGLLCPNARQFADTHQAALPLLRSTTVTVAGCWLPVSVRPGFQLPTFLVVLRLSSSRSCSALFTDL